MRALTLGIIILLNSFLVQADSGSHGKAWLSIIDKLQAQGVASVGALKLDQLKKEAKELKWHSAQKVPSVIAGPRTSAYYLLKSKEIFVADDLPEDLKTSLPDLELHEVLGALGYEDDKYTKSTALRILLETLPSQRAPLLKVLEKELFHRNNLRIDDGGTSVGGGGDIRAIVVKNQVLREIMKTSRRMNPEFLKNFPLLNFEPIYSKDIDYIAIDYKFNGRRAIESMGRLPRIPVKDGNQEIISFLIPIHQWEKGAPERRALLKDLRMKVMGFYPAYLQEQPSIKIPICDGRETVSIPKTFDGNVLYIQQFRWGFLKGCDRMIEFGSAAATSPKLSDHAMPPQPGQYYYECGFMRGAARYSEQVVVSENSNTTVLVDVMLDDRKELSAFTQFDGHGGIRKFILQLSDGEKSEYAAQKTVTSPLDQKISYRYKKQTIYFGCEKR